MTTFSATTLPAAGSSAGWCAARFPLLLARLINTPHQATLIAHLLTLLSLVNALYTFLRARHYRLFEASVDAVPRTPSARRVRVDSSPVASSPLRFLSSVLPAASTAASRAHPDPTADVWELAVWDPLPVCLRTFCLFSPGHVLVYWLFLPTRATDPRPSTTIATALLLAALLSAQLWLLKRSFAQQAKDTALVHSEVLHEYDTKFVHPRTQRLARDVGTQFAGPGTPRHHRADDGANTVELHAPRLASAFAVRPNPNYAALVDPDGRGYAETPTRRPAHAPPTRSTTTNATAGAQTGGYPQVGSALRPTAPQARDLASPLMQRSAAAQARQPYRASAGAGDGGSLGVYSHAQSPLKKARSTQFGPGSGVARERASGRRESGRF